VKFFKERWVMVKRMSPITEVAGAPGSIAAAMGGNGAVEKTPGPVALILIAAWFGLATGFVELVLLGVEWAYHPATQLDYRQVNRHYLWMIPLGELVHFGVCGVVVGLLGRIWPKGALRLAGYGLVGLAAMKLILFVPGLRKLTYFLLACGFASLLGPVVEARIRRFRFSVWRSISWLSGAIVVLACVSYGRELLPELLARGRLPAAKAGSPNVLLIVLDTVRADALSLYGYERGTSPNLVRLGQKGVRFDRALATAPWTLPSHATMFTGRWPHQLGVGWYRPLDLKYPTLAELLGARGYVTAGFVANTLFCRADYGLARGFHHYEDIPVSLLEVLRAPQLGERLMKILDTIRYKVSKVFGDEILVRVFGDDPRSSLAYTRCRKNAARISRDALNWLSGVRGRPFFVFMNYFDTHDPYFLPAGIEGTFGGRFSDRNERDQLRDWEDITRNLKDNAGLSPSTIKLARDCYDDCVAYLDDQLGRLFGELEARGLLENTLVVVTSDHGEHFGEHPGMFFHGRSLYSQETRVPLLVIDSRRVPSGRIVSEPVSLRDLPATIIDLVGLGGREVTLPGRSLAQFWNRDVAGVAASLSPVLSENEDTSLPSHVKDRLWQSISSGDNVYIRSPAGAEELYDIAADPVQVRNLAASAGASSVMERFRAALGQILAENSVLVNPGRFVEEGEAAAAEQVGE
jgi:arylsulfatase A-like enzyme